MPPTPSIKVSLPSSQSVSIIYTLYLYLSRSISPRALRFSNAFHNTAGGTETQGALRSFTHRCSHSVGFGVYEASDLCEVAVALGDELDGGALHEEGIVRGQDPLDALLHVLDHHGLPPAVHELPHLVVGWDFCFLQDIRKQILNEIGGGASEINLALNSAATSFNFAGSLFNVFAKCIYQNYLKNKRERNTHVQW